MFPVVGPAGACSWPVGMAGHSGDPTAHAIMEGQGLPGQSRGVSPRSLFMAGATVPVPHSSPCPHASHTPVISRVLSLLHEQFLIFKNFYQKLTIPSLPLPLPALVAQRGPAQLTKLQPLIGGGLDGPAPHAHVHSAVPVSPS